MPVYKIADKRILIESKTLFVNNSVAPYLCADSEYDIDARVSEKDIRAEIGEADNFSEASAEYLAIYRKICNDIYKYEGALIHCAVVAVNGEAFAFLAKSGTGKSTHLRQWKKVFGEEAIIVNGDKPIIRIIDGVPYAYGTPWAGKEGWNTNTAVPLAAFCFLERGEKNSISPISEKDAGIRFFDQLYLPKSTEAKLATVGLADKMLKLTPAYLLKCTISEESAIIAYNAMKSNK